MAGGARKGAGRKPKHESGSGQHLSVWISPAVLDALEREAAKSKCLRAEVIDRLLERGLRALGYKKV